MDDVDGKSRTTTVAAALTRGTGIGQYGTMGARAAATSRLRPRWCQRVVIPEAPWYDP
jgi:hypothetical protein